MKKLLQIMLIVVIITSSLLSNVYAATYFVTGDGVRVRSNAQNLGESNVIGKLNYGTVLNIVGVEGDWVKIKVGNAYGYITKTFIHAKEAIFRTNSIAVMKNWTALKSNTSYSANTTCYIPAGGIVKVGTVQNGWAFVQYNGLFGYIPSNTPCDLSRSNSQICAGAYTIAYSLNDSQRASNIANAASKLNRYKIQPGETFSFLNAIGTDGYSYAPEYSDSERTFGGGLSDVATALYKCVREAQNNGGHLSVIDKTRNYEKTPYAATGEEAMISIFEQTDFTFKNNTNYTIIIYSFVNEETISFAIAGIL